MINGTYGKNIMDAMAKGTTVTFPTPYLGLLKTMPNAAGSGGEEVSYPEYCRVAINVTGLEGKNIMAAAVSATITDDGESKTQSSAENQEIIYFPENETGEATTAVGVGIFSSRATGTTPYFWVPFKDANGDPQTVTINKNSCPMFRIGKFKLKVK